MRKQDQVFLIFVVATSVFAFSIGANAQLKYPPVYPANATGATAFDWQDAWGSIHINSGADGLNDPGSHASSTGKVPCVYGALCNESVIKNNINSLQSDQVIDNGIKYDIKNSVLNCMSKAIPNWAKKEGDHTPTGAFPYQVGVCSKVGLKPGYGTNTVQPGAMIFMPIYDRRSNDVLSTDLGTQPGCVQQITNTCVHDVHECKDPNNAWKSMVPEGQEGWRYPVTHVFTADEVSDLGGAGTQLPTKYYAYEKITSTGDEVKDAASLPTDPSSFLNGTSAPTDCTPKGSKSVVVCTKYTYTPITGHRHALSRTYPPADEIVPGTTITEVDNTADPNLQRIKSYRFKNPEGNKEFIIIDPSDFFDVKLYMAGEKYDSGYTQKTSTGLPATYDSCPIIGLHRGYGGICDPEGKAGCNLPIYEVGPETTFKDVSGKSFKYSPYPIKWSGYVKRWAIIDVNQYLANIAGREALYATGKAINSNPILMITRADDYCDVRERTSNYLEAIAAGVAPKPDMPCIQYLQYTPTDPNETLYTFMDLYLGEKDNYPKSAEYHTIHLFNIDANGKPEISSPVPGTGDNRYLGKHGTRGSSTYVSFRDKDNPLAVYNDAKRKIKGAKAIVKSSAIFNTSNAVTVGSYLATDPKTGLADKTKGTGIALEAGTLSAVRMPTDVTFDKSNTSCVTFNYSPTGENKVFVPTNTVSEYQSFVTAVQAGQVDDVTVQKCNAGYMDLTDPINASLTSDKAVAGTKTWTGLMNCKQLADKPACNQTKRITAHRYCQLETGGFDSCESCMGADDPDKNFNFSDLGGGELMGDPRGKNRCYFSAACFSMDSSAGCPAAGTSGGHVFCLSADTKITMADGTQKAISKIKAGEEVKAFDAKFARSAQLRTARVKAIAITKQQKIMKINELKITPPHKIVLATGRAVAAQDIKVGDKILNGNGLTEEVTKIETDLDPITVYNLVLENGSDGYIAGGLRVISYPILKGLAKR